MSGPIAVKEYGNAGVVVVDVRWSRAVEARPQKSRRCDLDIVVVTVAFGGNPCIDNGDLACVRLRGIDVSPRSPTMEPSRAFQIETFENPAAGKVDDADCRRSRVADDKSHGFV